MAQEEDEDLFTKLEKHPDEEKLKQDRDSRKERKFELDDDQDSDDSDEESIEDIKESQIYQIKVPSNSDIKFELSYSPPELSNYEFVLPISIKGYGMIDSLKKVVKCKGN